MIGWIKPIGFIRFSGSSGGGDSGTPIDLFVIVGQSNAEGRGNSSLSPNAEFGRFWDGAALVPLVDPVAGADTGSAWPSFSNEWHENTGRLSAFVEVADGGSSLIPEQAGANWSPLGSLRSSAVSAANGAIGHIVSNSAYSLASVYFVWSQGEQEAETINGTTITGALYTQALKSLADYFQAQVDEFTQMLVIRTGTRNDLASAVNWGSIRAAQDLACAEAANLRMVYRGTFSFNAAGRALMSDSVHWGQEGLNLVGKCAALAGATFSDDPPVESAPAILAAQAYIDTTLGTKSSATNAHTTAVGTKTLVVAVSYSRIASSTTNVPTNVTFNGVAMVKAKALANQSAGANAAPSQRADVGTFYLTEDQYGASLSGVSANIVATAVSGTNITISVAAYNLDSDVVQDSALGVRISSTTGNILATAATTGAPAVLIGTTASAGLSAAPLTHSISGLTLTGEGGITDGTQCGQAAFGSAIVGEITANAITTTMSGDVRAAAFLVTAFRKKINGE